MERYCPDKQIKRCRRYQPGPDYSNSGTFVEGVEVVVLDADGDYLTSGYSTPDGSYETYGALPTGTYRVRTSNFLGYLDELHDDLPLHRTEDIKSTNRFRDLEQNALEKVRANAQSQAKELEELFARDIEELPDKEGAKSERAAEHVSAENRDGRR